MSKKKLVIVGGGFAGITVAKQLLKTAPKKFSITLIDKKDYQLFYPALSKAASTFAEPSAIFSVLAIKFKDIFLNNKINILKKEVLDVLFKENKVVLKSMANRRQFLDYDYLVLALGSQTDSNFLTLRSFEDTLKIKSALEHVLKIKAKREQINITIVGAGATGCSLAARLHNYACKLANLCGHPHESIKIRLIETKKSVLSSESFWLQKRVEKCLLGKGIKILLSHEYDKTLAKEDIVIFATGAKYMHFGKHENVFSVEAETAQSAIHQAKHVAGVLKKLIENKKSMLYKPNKKVTIIDLGNNHVFADLGFIKLKGAPAKWFKYLVFLKYFAGILGWQKAFEWLKKYRSL